MDTIDWKMGKTRDDKEIRWIPIATIDFEYQKVIGLSINKSWVTTFMPPRTTDLFLINDRLDCYHIIAILDKEREEIEKKIRAGIEELNLPIDVHDSFPFLDLIKFSLSAAGTHWAFKGARWLLQDEFDDELVGIVNSNIAKKNMDQKTRHKLFAMMKRYERSKASG